MMNGNDDALDIFEGEGGREAPVEKKNSQPPLAAAGEEEAAVGAFVAEGGRDDLPA